MSQMNSSREKKGARQAIRTASSSSAAAVAAAKDDKVMNRNAKNPELRERRSRATNAWNRCQSRRDRKLALLHDVDKLRKKLRYEENIHRALERAFTRPFGVLPRLPPYLPSHTLELLAEVAILEEEVVRLEEQVVNFQQGLIEEVIFVSPSTKSKENARDGDSEQVQSTSATTRPKFSRSSRLRKQEASHQPRDASSINGLKSPNEKHSSKAQNPRSPLVDQHRNERRSTTVRKASAPNVAALPTNRNTQSQQEDQRSSEVAVHSDPNKMMILKDSNGPNELSEQILVCLMKIFLRRCCSDSTDDKSMGSSSVSGKFESSEESDYSHDIPISPRIASSSKQLHTVDSSNFSGQHAKSSCFMSKRLKDLLSKLATADLSGLGHQQNLAFWINIYNSCMMNGFLQHGVPASPHKLVELMPKAKINVGGHLLTAMTIEHFILRSPYNAKHGRKGMESEELTMKGIFGLEWPEPLITFALSCGSRSSPAVRVYTASKVEEELQRAKSDYLQSSVEISARKVAIPKLLHWRTLDFAKDVESLMDWICLQLPSERQSDAVKCLGADAADQAAAQPVHVLPYDFTFSYLLALPS